MSHRFLYALLLDLLPLTDEVVMENIVLGDALQRAALDALLRSSIGEDPIPDLTKVKVLLALSRDLGYASPEVVDVLERSIARAVKA